MKGICSNPKCGKEIEYLKNSISVCLDCGHSLIPEYVDGYKGVWMSPDTIILRLEGLLKKYDYSFVLKSNKFKHEREAWVSAVWALGITHEINTEIWIEIETTEETPDTYVFYFDVIDNRNYKRVFNIEVADWEEHTDDLLNIIKNKSKKNYPDYFILLIYARNPKKKINSEEIYSKLKKIKIPFSEIWILTCTGNDDYVIQRLYPQKSEIPFNVKSLRDRFKNQISFAKFLKRGRGTDLENLGNFYLPLP